MGNFEKYEIVSSEVVFEGKVLSLSVDKVRFPTGEIHERETVRHKGAVGIVAVTNDYKVILVEQYRHPVEGALLEIPAGKLDPGEDPLDCVSRELAEETGSTCEKIIKLAEFYTTPGYSDELFYLYLGLGLREGEREEGREEEQDLEVTKVPLDEALLMISSGEIRDGKTIAGLTLAERYLQLARKK